MTTEIDLVRSAAARLVTPDGIAAIEQALDAFPAYRRFVADRGEGEEHLRGIQAVGESLAVFLRWFVEREPPTDEDLARLRATVALRAAEGRDRDDGVAVIRCALEAGNRVVVSQATLEERAAIATRLPVILGWLDLIERLFDEVYDEQRDAVVGRTEQRARVLLSQLLSTSGAASGTEEMAASLAIALPDRWHACVLTVAGASTVAHAEIAAKLRDTGVLAVFDGPWVIAVGALVDPATVGFSDRILVVRGPGPVAVDELRDLVDELHEAARLARDAGRRGVVGTDDYLADLLLWRVPRVARRIVARVYGPLRAGGRDDLVATVDALVDHGFERRAAAAALPVHRNTLAQRLERIEGLTGLRLDDQEDRLLVALARRARAKS